jgi:D-alanine-D-alanine ligase
MRAIETSLAAWRGLGCRDGGRIDLRSDKNGVPNFLEVNPLAGLNPVISDLPILCGLNGISYQELIKRIMDSALERIDTYSCKSAKQ